MPFTIDQGRKISELKVGTLFTAALVGLCCYAACEKVALAWQEASAALKEIS
jgi:hypothetical protein